MLVLTIFVFHLIFSFRAFIFIPAMKPIVFVMNIYADFLILVFSNFVGNSIVHVTAIHSLGFGKFRETF